jgi:hypothetical protein
MKFRSVYRSLMIALVILVVPHTNLFPTANPGEAYSGTTSDADQGSFEFAPAESIMTFGTPDLITRQVEKLTRQFGSTGDGFGASLDIEGDIAVVGAHLQNSGIGGVYLYKRNKGGMDEWDALGALARSDPYAGDWFGYEVAISDDTIVVGAPFDDDNGDGSGSAYIFERNQGGPDWWNQVVKLTASDGAAGDKFGFSVDIDGDTVIVGAREDDTSRGSAYVFERNSGGMDYWGQVQKLTSADRAETDYFGNSVAIDGGLIVVGASGDDDGGSSAGSAYVFERNQDGLNAWGQIHKLGASDSGTNKIFGSDVDIFVDTIVVGAQGWMGIPGSAYVFHRNQSGVDSWGQVEKLTAFDGGSYDNFGLSVSLYGDFVVVGADSIDSYAGAGYLFERNQGGMDQWELLEKITGDDTTDSDRFGGDVAMNADNLLIGADGVVSQTGAAYLFTRKGAGWEELERPNASDLASGDRFGASLATRGSMLVIGSPDDNTLTGAVYVFERNESGADSWDQVKKITAHDAAAYDNFGASVDIDGDTIAVGAPGDDDGGESSGSVYIFERNQGGMDEWGVLNKLTASDAGSSDMFGISVSIDRGRVLVGASHGDGTQGAAYLFERNYGGADAWGQVARMTASDGDVNHYFGNAVDLDNDTAVIGSYWDDSNGLEAGAAYIFVRNTSIPDDWDQIQKVTPVDAGAGDEFGTSVGIHGQYVIIGAPGNDDAGAYTGAAYVFRRNLTGEDAWGQAAKLTADDRMVGDRFGIYVDLDVDTAVVGAIGVYAAADDAGAAYVFERNREGMNLWGQVQRLTASNGGFVSNYGNAVGIVFPWIVIGASNHNAVGSGSGAAYVYRLESASTYLPLVGR